ncbi:MAG: hypothetical protein RIR00_2353 [Pseudomonadota bacterium]|jgi:general secretion pathway protein D
MKSWYSLCLLPLLVACNSGEALRRGESAIAAGQYEEGLKLIEGEAQTPLANHEARLALIRSRALVAEKLEQDAQGRLDDARLEEAAALFERLRPLDNERAEAGLRKIRAAKEIQQSLDKVETLIQRGELEPAQRLLKSVQTQAPRHRRAQLLATQLAEKLPPPRNATQPELSPDFRKKVTLEFRDVGLKALFDALWHASGINFVLDKDIRGDGKATLMVKDVTVEEAVEAILVTQQLGKRVLGPNLLYIYPRTPQKIGEYQELLIRNFFLAHVGAKELSNELKTILKMKEVYADEKRNVIVVRDTPEKVALAEKLIQAQDQPEPEVILEVDVIEINRSRLLDLGLGLPQKVDLGVANPITLQALRGLNSSGINVGVGGLGASTTTTTNGILAQLRAASTLGDTKTLANPRIRVRNREKAKIHIGDRLPVVTTTSSVTSSFVGQTVNYLDVGLKLEVEPEVMLENDVVIKLNMEVSSASQDKANPSFYDVGTRNTATVLTIRDGETQLLAGLIRDDETQSVSGIPGLSELPLLGRLFSNNQNNRTKSEILLAITPHVLRNLQRPGPALLEYLSGSESGQGSTGAGSAAAAANPGGQRPIPAQTSPAPPQTGLSPNFASGSNSPGSPSSFGVSTTPPTTAPSSPPATTTATTTTTTTTTTTGGASLPVFDLPPGVGAK